MKNRTCLIIIIVIFSFFCLSSCGSDEQTPDDSAADGDQTDTNDTDKNENEADASDFSENPEQEEDAKANYWVDLQSNLTWQIPATHYTADWRFAVDYCEDLETGGYDQWRLPSISELRSLIRGCASTDLSGDCNVGDYCLSKSCWSETACWSCTAENVPENGCYWPENLTSTCGLHWSSSRVEDVDLGNRAWAVSFGDASVNYYNFSYKAHIRCVF